MFEQIYQITNKENHIQISNTTFFLFFLFIIKFVLLLCINNNLVISAKQIFTMNDFTKYINYLFAKKKKKHKVGTFIRFTCG